MNWGFNGWRIWGACLAIFIVAWHGKARGAEVSFRNNVQPVLAKAGCNAGACHGAVAGQNGFHLSLRGYDDDGDWLALTRQALGRRVTPSNPGNSLLLLKATATVPHKGGKRFEVESVEYNILADWIAMGAPGPKADEPRIERIQIDPPSIVLANGTNFQFKVTATFSDGHQEDVTRWTKYTAANASVTTVDDVGNVKVVGFGEGAITGWYLSRLAIANVAVPYTNQVPAETYAKVPQRNFIDTLGLEKLRSLNLPPSPRCTDEEFIRRAFIDTIGLIPKAQEVRDFLKDPSTTKRDTLIENLLQRPEYVDYWAYKWSDLLLVSSKKLSTPAVWSYHNWIHNEVAANTPWDEMTRRLVTAQGSTLENGAANFYVLRDDPRDMSEMTSQAFLGMSINCAKCHNHPMEKWTNDQYYQMANLFARVRMKTGPQTGEQIIFAAASGDLVQPLRGKAQTPAPLDGKSLAMEDPTDRRIPMAQWLTAPENPYFTRAIVNRVWANYLGVGLVESVDDLRVSNPASDEVLFAATTKFLVSKNYDLRALMRLILQSETYQRSSTALASNEGDSRFYSHYYSKRMMAEVLLDSVSAATGAPTSFKGYPEGWRALQLPDSNIDSYFLKSFGRPERDKTCECERTGNPSISQVLHISNGDTINEKLTAKNNGIDQWLMAKKSPESMLEEAYLGTLARFPTEKEKAKFLAPLQTADAKEQRALLEDMMWALLSTKEFLFNH